jgi:hypothetical protein
MGKLKDLLITKEQNIVARDLQKEELRLANGKCGVYRIYHSITGWSYIGQSRNIGRRWHQHWALLINSGHSNHQLQKDWNMCDGVNYRFEVIKELSNDCDDLELNRLEAESIVVFDSYNCGYNYTVDGQRPERYLSEQQTRKTNIPPETTSLAATKHTTTHVKTTKNPSWFSGVLLMLACGLIISFLMANIDNAFRYLFP